MRIVVALALAHSIAACAGCDGGGGIPDAARPDAGLDAAIDAPAACTGTALLTGELIDFDSTTTAFLGVFDAVFTVRAEPACTDRTAPNGRFEVMVQPGVDVVVDVEAPGGYLDAVFVAEATAITGAGVISLRLPTLTRARAFYLSDVGAAFDEARPHVLVHDLPDRVALALDVGHDAPQAASDDDGDGAFTWAAGDTGRFVLFPNVAAQPAATLSGDPAGPLAVPLDAGRLTLVAEHVVVL